MKAMKAREKECNERMNKCIDQSMVDLANQRTTVEGTLGNWLAESGCSGFGEAHPRLVFARRALSRTSRLRMRILPRD